MILPLAFTSLGSDTLDGLVAEWMTFLSHANIPHQVTIILWIGSPRLERVCHLCATGTVGDEKHLIFECPELQCLGSSGHTYFKDHKQCWISCGKMILLALPSISMLAYVR